MSHPTTPSLTYRQELLRKSVHLSSLWVVVLYYFTDQDVMLNVLIPLTLIVLLIDGARRCSGKKCPMMEAALGYIMRNHEREKFSGASYLMVSALILVLIFPQIIAMTSFAYLIIGDSAAALVGRAIGRVRLVGKTLEGSIAFLVFSLACMAVMQHLYQLDNAYIIAASIAACVAMMVELFSKKLRLDDNFTIPISAALTMVVVQYSLGAS